MTRLPELQRQLIAAAAALGEGEREGASPASPAPARRPRVRRLPATRVLVLTVLTVLVLAALAVAATGLLGSGADVPTRSGRPPQPTTALGVPTAPISPLVQVADPAGGLPWGLRTFHTSRGYACLQVGRVQDGRLGLLGRDGAFDDDGLFHALKPQVLDQSTCAPLDGAGHGFLVLHYAAYPGSGLGRGCLTVPEVEPGDDPRPACPTGDLRRLDFGLLGPHATAVTSRAADGTLHTTPAVRGTGAFLVVAPQETQPPVTPGRRRTDADDEYLVGRSPASLSIAQVHYDDGSVCHVHHGFSSNGGCPAVGLVPVHVRAPTRAAVATPMRVQLHPGRNGTADVSFRARVATTSSRAAYYLMVYPPAEGCQHRGAVGNPIWRDVAVGQTVSVKPLLPGGDCHGRYRFVLSYRVQTVRSTTAGVTNLRYPGTIVATRTLTVR
ncbi:MAG TPA: hypothetical protein VGM33_19760 [Baekduia sp.]|jgi:hypothetical protein